MPALRQLRPLLWDAARVLRWDDEAPGFALVRCAWKGGWLTRLGLVMLVLGTALVSWLVVAAAAPGTTDSSQTPMEAVRLAPPLVALVLLLYAFALGLGLAAATTLPLPLYVALAIPVGWYGILPAGGTVGTLLFAVPPLLLLTLGVVTARTAASSARTDTPPSRLRARLWLLPLALAAGYATRGTFHLSFPTQPALDLVASLGLGLALWLLATLPAWLAPSPTPPRLALRALLIGTALGATWLVGTLRAPEATADRLVLLGRALLLPIALFWLWLGGTTFQGVLAIGAWTARAAGRLIGPRALGVTLPSLWLVVGVFAWFATWPLPLWAAVLADDLGLAAWSFGLEASTWFALRILVFASPLAVLLLLALSLRDRLDHAALIIDDEVGQRRLDRLSTIHGLWCATFLGVIALWEAAEDAVAAGDEPLPVTAWAGLLLIGGLVWEGARSGGDWAEASSARLLGVLAALLGFVGLAASGLGAHLPDLLTEYAFYGLLGVVVLGVPLALADLLSPSDEDSPSLSGPRTMGLALLGAVSAMLVLGLDPWAGPMMALAPPLWTALLLTTRARFELQRPRLAASAGAALGLGFAIFWLSPEALPLPIIDLWQQRYLALDLARPVFDAGAFALPLVALGIGGGLGLIIARGRLLIVALATLLAAAALAFAAMHLPDLPTGPPMPPAAVASP